ncbi:hypothetical protein [Kitasatospora arboriphila]|uniref:Uncharacterized protein n=1 Tax=Kitasatospora arboriphila TaxID=258052 RepID=A0ABN1TBC8_9ACTN
MLVAGTVLGLPSTAEAKATRYRQGSANDVSRASWAGPAYTMNGSGGIVGATMAKAVDAIRGCTGTVDVTVLAASAASGSPAPECDVIAGLPNVNSCTTYVLTSAQDASGSQ